MTDDTADWVSPAERIVRERWGDRASLGDSEGLDGSNRSYVHRVTLDGVNDAPETVVVKQARLHGEQEYDPDSGKGPAYGLLNDWSGLAFLEEAAPDGPWPALYGGDRSTGVIVFEDLGAARQIDHVLLGDDGDEAEHVMFAYVRSLARLHAATAGKAERYHEIRSGLGPREIATYAGRVRTFAEALRERDLGSDGLSDELNRCADELESPGPFLVYTHGDSCPDNCLVIEGEVWLLDFEWGDIRHALIDGTFPWIHFPSCWCVNHLPGDLPERLMVEYRTHLAEGIPEASDDRLFGNGVVAASVAGFANNFGDDVFESDRRWGISTVRQRARLRVRILSRTAELYGFPYLAEVCTKLGDQLDDLWSEVELMPIYPAFRAPATE